MTTYEKVLEQIAAERRTWLVTGVAGFIGSHLLEKLLLLDQQVIGLDNFSTGSRINLDLVEEIVGAVRWNNFKLLEGDIRSIETCRQACNAVDFVLHQAALGSVPRSVDDPINTNENNVTGFLNMLVAARDAGVSRFVYAASSSVYGDDQSLPKVENVIGHPLSPYAVSKYLNELYAEVFARNYRMQSIGLRYFNVFGPRQRVNGEYPAVIPAWIAALLNNETVFVNGDGKTGRDFCYVDNAVQANLLAAIVEPEAAINQVYNVAVNAHTSLNEVFEMIREMVAVHLPRVRSVAPVYRPARQGDMKFSRADISKAGRMLGYYPLCRVRYGLEKTVGWYVEKWPVIVAERGQAPSQSPLTKEQSNPLPGESAAAVAEPIF